MNKNNARLYLLGQNKDRLELEITPKRTYRIMLYIAVMIMSIISIGFFLYFFFIHEFYSSRDYIIEGCIFIAFWVFLLFALYLLLWETTGKEIYIIHSHKLEKIISIVGIKGKTRVFEFNTLEFSYHSGAYYYTEDEDDYLELVVDFDIDSVQGCYPIRFYMDDGMNVVDSELKIPIEMKRLIKKEYALLCDRENSDL